MQAHQLFTLQLQLQFKLPLKSLNEGTIEQHLWAQWD